MNVLTIKPLIYIYILCLSVFIYFWHVVMLSSPLISPRQQGPRNEIWGRKKIIKTIIHIPSFSKTAQIQFLRITFKNPVKQYEGLRHKGPAALASTMCAAGRKDNQSDSEDPTLSRRLPERHLCTSYRGWRPVSFRSLGRGEGGDPTEMVTADGGRKKRGHRSDCGGDEDDGGGGGGDDDGDRNTSPAPTAALYIKSSSLVRRNVTTAPPPPFSLALSCVRASLFLFIFPHLFELELLSIFCSVSFLT